MFQVDDIVEFVASNDPGRIGAICKVKASTAESSSVLILKCPLDPKQEGSSAATQNWKIKLINYTNKEAKRLLKSK